MVLAAALGATVAACHALPPPPVIAPHEANDAEAVGTTTAMIVVGYAGSLGGMGWGTALRVENQTRERTTLGIELTGGRGLDPDHFFAADGSPFRMWLVGARVYGRYTPVDTQRFSALYGAGVSLMANGLVTGTLNVGTESAYDNTRLEPLGALGLAIAVPIVHGRAYAEPSYEDVMYAEGSGVGPPPSASDRKLLTSSTAVYLGVEVGFVAPIGSTGNRLSASLGFAYVLTDDDTVFQLSAADSQH